MIRGEGVLTLPFLVYSFISNNRPDHVTVRVHSADKRQLSITVTMTTETCCYWQQGSIDENPPSKDS